MPFASARSTPCQACSGMSRRATISGVQCISEKGDRETAWGWGKDIASPPDCMTTAGCGCVDIYRDQGRPHLCLTG